MIKDIFSNIAVLFTRFTSQNTKDKIKASLFFKFHDHHNYVFFTQTAPCFGCKNSSRLEPEEAEEMCIRILKLGSKVIKTPSHLLFLRDILLVASQSWSLTFLTSSILIASPSIC